MGLNWQKFRAVVSCPIEIASYTIGSKCWEDIIAIILGYMLTGIGVIGVHRLWGCDELTLVETALLPEFTVGMIGLIECWHFVFGLYLFIGDWSCIIRSYCFAGFWAINYFFWLSVYNSIIGDANFINLKHLIVFDKFLNLLQRPNERALLTISKLLHIHKKYFG